MVREFLNIFAVFVFEVLILASYRIHLLFIIILRTLSHQYHLPFQMCHFRFLLLILAIFQLNIFSIQLIVVFFCSCGCLRLAVPILRAESRQLRALLSILPSLLNVGSHTPTLYFLYFMLDGRTGTWRRCTLAQWKLPLS